MSDPIIISTLKGIDAVIAKLCDDDGNGKLEEKNANGVNEISLFNSKLEDFKNSLSKDVSIFNNKEVAPRDATYVAPKFVEISPIPAADKAAESAVTKHLPLNLSGKTSTAYKEYNPEILEKALEQHIKDNSKLKGKVKYFIEKGKEQNVDPLILIAIAMHESARGLSNPAALKRNNIGGICDNAKARKAGHFVSKTFASVEECIDSMAVTLSSYAAAGRTTINDLPPQKPRGKGYCQFSVREAWINKILTFAKDISSSYNEILKG